MLIATAICAPAFASPGDHIRPTDGMVITPSVNAGVGAHSNVYLADQDPVAAPDLTFGAHLKLQYEQPDHAIGAGVGWAGRKFLDTDPKDAVNVQNLDQFNNFDGSLDLKLFRRSRLGLRVNDGFQVTNTPTELGTAKSNANIVTISNDTNGGLLIRPGSALEIGVLGQVGIDSYRVPDAFAEEVQLNASFNDRASYGPTLSGRWALFPKTAVQGQVGMIWNRWSDNLIRAAGPEVEGLDYGDYLGKPDSMGWRTTWGIKGQFTAKLGAEVSLGFGQLWYDEQTVLDEADTLDLAESSAELDLTDTSKTAENFARDLTSFREGSLATVQLSWVALPGQTINVGWKKDFQDAFFTNYVAYNTFFAKYQGNFLDERLKPSAELGWRFDNFHGEVARADLNVRAAAGAAWQFTPFLSAQLQGGWTERACAQKGCNGGAFEPTEYDDFYGNLGATLTW